MLTHDLNDRIRPENLVPPQSRDFEFRLVIWSIEGIPQKDRIMDLFVNATLQDNLANEMI